MENNKSKKVSIKIGAKYAFDDIIKNEDFDFDILFRWKIIGKYFDL